MEGEGAMTDMTGAMEEVEGEAVVAGEWGSSAESHTSLLCSG